MEEPKDELERVLLRIWQKILGNESVGLRDNFFECGGHSLAAVRVFSEIGRELGHRLPLAALFQAPTVELLAAFIRRGEWKSDWGALVPLRSEGTRPPFFCVHAVGGNVLEYKELSGQLDPEQPFYALQSVGMDGIIPPLTTIGEMAEAYLKEVRRIQPKGPYYLGGRSFGGTVAYEMACQLDLQGEEVALLAIFDSYPFGWFNLCSEEEAEYYRRRFRKLRIKRHLENWRKLSITGKANYFFRKIYYKKGHYRRRLRRFIPKLRLFGNSPADERILQIEKINYGALRKYIPDTYPGIVTFFSAFEEICEEENITGWQKLAPGGVKIVRVPGNHQTMIREPHVRDLAERLEASLGHTKGSGLREPVLLPAD